MKSYNNNANIEPHRDKNKITIKRDNEIIEAIKLYLGKKILDVGVRNPFVKKIEKILNVNIDSTLDTDLDFEVKAPDKNYDLIIFSHVIEHLINPLFVLCELKKLLSEGGKIIIAHPTRFIKYKVHYHEIPLEDLEVLIKKAGMRTIYQKSYLMGKRFPLGIRPIIKYFIGFWKDKNHVTVVSK